MGADPLKVCVFTDTFPKLSETFVRDQVLGLICAGVSVTVITDRAAALPPGLQHLRVERRWGALSLIEPWLRRLPPRISDLAITGLDRAFARKLCGFDAVIAHFGTNGVRVARIGRRTLGFPPLITIFHGYDVGMAAHDRTLDQYQPIFSFPGLVLTVNQPFREILIEAGSPPDRTRVHHFGIEPESVPFRRRDWYGQIEILSVCRLTEKKGIALALEALARLKAEAPEHDWRYVIIGDGELRQSLEKLANDLGVSSRVKFHGAVPHAQVRAALNTAHIFLLPSLTASTGDMEGIPIVLMEAMASGALVVSSNHSGIPELVSDAKSGFLAPEGDVAGLYRRLLFMMDNRTKLDPLIDEALRVIRTEFNLDRQSAELIGWLFELRDNTGSTPREFAQEDGKTTAGDARCE